MKQLFLVTVLALLVAPLTMPMTVAAQAQPGMPSVEESPQIAFEKMFRVPAVPVTVPTVVEVPLPEPVSSGERFLVYEQESRTFLGSYLRQEVTALTTMNVTSVPMASTVSLIDGRLDTYANFPVPEEGTGQVTLTIMPSRPVTTSQLSLRLDKYVALPLTVQVRYQEVGTSVFQTLVTRTDLTSNTIFFPEVTAQNFEVTFTYIQPLRIAELQLVENRPATERTQFLRFLAQPGRSYTVYYSADRYVATVESETGDLRRDEGVMSVAPTALSRNPLYRPADVDGDGVVDSLDNCVNEQNPDQADIDRNGRGDACDDWDRDGVLNSHDNCVEQPNRDQQDTDVDSLGDVCDTEESRFTERNPWVPWVGMGTAVGVLLLLFVLVARKPETVVPEVGDAA